MLLTEVYLGVGGLHDVAQVVGGRGTQPIILHLLQLLQQSGGLVQALLHPARVLPPAPCTRPAAAASTRRGLLVCTESKMRELVTQSRQKKGGKEHTLT